MSELCKLDGFASPALDAMKQALEFILKSKSGNAEKYFSFEEMNMITNLHQAIEQAKQEPVVWVGLTDEDWMSVPNSGKVGCERDAEMFDWIEAKLKEKNT